MSGPGKIQIFTYTPWELQALLYNFEINSAILRAEHENWIRSQIGVHSAPKGVDSPPQRTRNMEALICGLTSRTGSDALNWALSQRRARTVFDAIWRLDHGSFLVGAKFGLGEEAARLAGLRDNTEDERWRSVFVRIYDSTKVRVHGPFAKAPGQVERPSMRKFVAELKTSSPFESKEDKRADAIADLVQKQMARRDWSRAKIDEKQVSVPETFKLWQISTSLIDGSVELGIGNTTLRVCRVDYFWGPPKKGPCVLINGYWSFGAGKANPPRITTLSQPQMDAWLENPYKALQDHVGEP